MLKTRRPQVKIAAQKANAERRRIKKEVRVRARRCGDLRCRIAAQKAKAERQRIKGKANSVLDLDPENEPLNPRRENVTRYTV